MSVLSAILTGVAMGIVFGFALEKARVFEPGMIVGQMQMRNFIMLKVFLTAVATGAVVLAALHGFGLVKLAPKATFYAADVLGGLVLGAGIALAGACPGTILAQIGAGYRDALFTLAGGIAGAVAFGYAEPALAPWLLSGGPGKLTFMDLTGLSYTVLALGLAAVLVVVLVVLERWRPWQRELGADVDGDFGPAVAPSVVPATRLKPVE
ncbi:YeeE/YedE thiosulfate transporter family protein [Xanthobacter autotrophicus]|uniref:YeeE/YedE thiosulfate transporter family protein n=1 Tax=Xanthobacter autotrophicus TaxID=280 RepID=UPI003726A5BA